MSAACNPSTAAAAGSDAGFPECPRSNGSFAARGRSLPAAARSAPLPNPDADAKVSGCRPDARARPLHRRRTA